MKVEVKPCPCGQCTKFVVPPLFTSVESSLYKDEADELARRWNHFEEHKVSSEYRQGSLNETEISMIGAALRVACQNADIEDYRLYSFGMRLWNELGRRGFKIERTVLTENKSVNEPLYPIGRTFESAAEAIVDRLLHNLESSSWTDAQQRAYHHLKDYKVDMVLDVLKVLKGEL